MNPSAKALSDAKVAVLPCMLSRLDRCVRCGRHTTCKSSTGTHGESDTHLFAYECAPVPTYAPPSTMRYSGRIGVLANQLSRISRVPAAYRAWDGNDEPDTWGVIPWFGIVRQG